MVLAFFTILLFSETFMRVSQVTQIELVENTYALEKLMYQLTTSGFPKLLEYHILGHVEGVPYHKALCRSFPLFFSMMRHFQ